MRTLSRLLLGMIALSNANALFAANTANVTVTINILAESDITFSGNPAPFNVTPGNSPQTDTSTTYSVTTNQSSQRITASLGSALPTGVTLTANLTAPSGATSAGAVTLSTTAQALVTGITQVNQANLPVTYSVSVTPAAAVANGVTSVITYTISS